MKIGFTLGLSKGGPSIFMDRLKKSLKKISFTKISYFFDPSIDVSIFANRVRNPWKKPYVMRVDGMYHGSHMSIKEKREKNNPIIEGINESIGIIYQSKYSEFLINKFFDINESIPSTIINNGINVIEYNKKGKNLRKKLGINKEDLVFISSANWRPQKRLDSIIKLFLKFKKKYKKKTYLIIIGNVNTNKYDNLSKNVIFTGKVNNIDLPNWYRTGDICIFLSLIDNCPNTVIEALASNLPVLCTNLGGTKELIELTKGGIVSNADRTFNLKKINLNNPPLPNGQRIFKDLLRIVKLRKKISKEMDLNEININQVSKHYYNFLKKII